MTSVSVARPERRKAPLRKADVPVTSRSIIPFHSTSRESVARRWPPSVGSTLLDSPKLWNLTISLHWAYA
jgi:hypothetical protein